MERRRRDREEQHLYLPIGVATEDNFKAHQGFDLANWDNDPAVSSAPKPYRVLRASTVGDFAKTLAEENKVPPEHVRLWVMVNRQNKTVRPDQPLQEPSMTIDEAHNKYGSRDKLFRLWFETAETLDNGKPVWPDMQPQTSNNLPILVFLKYFDAEAQSLKGVGHIYIRKHAKVADMVPMILQLMDWSSQTTMPTLALYEASRSSRPSPVDYLTFIIGDKTFYDRTNETEVDTGASRNTRWRYCMFPESIVRQGVSHRCWTTFLVATNTIIRASSVSQSGGYSDAREFYDYLLNRIIIRFFPRIPTDREEDTFQLALSRKMSYDQFSAKVGEHLKVDSTHIRFSTINATSNKPKSIVKRLPNQNLFQILSPQFGIYNSTNQRSDALFYEVLDMSVSEMDTKKILKVTWVSEGIQKEVCIECWKL